MKVAIISNDDSSVGKTTLAVLLGGIFSSIKRERVAIFCDKAAEDYPTMCEMLDKNKAAAYISVFRASLENGKLKDEDLFPYGRLIKNTQAYVFDIIHPSLADVDIEAMFMSAIKLSNAPLTIVDTSGNFEDERTQEIIDTCNAILYVVDCNPKSLKKAREFRENYPDDVVNRTLFVVSRFNNTSCSEKHAAGLIGVKQKSIMTFPYSPAILKSVFEGNLQALVSPIITGDPNVVACRAKAHDILAALFNEKDYKYIPDVKDWKVGG